MQLRRVEERSETAKRSRKDFARKAKLAFSYSWPAIGASLNACGTNTIGSVFFSNRTANEKYMQLLETYLDDPRRDEIIAREMGWTQLLDAKDWSAEVDALLDENAAENDDNEVDHANASAETFQEHGLYRAAFDLTLWIDQLFDQNATLQNEPAAVKLATHAALASAKLAAALSGDHLDEIGMTIAYLKRALKAITTSMNAAAELRKAAGLISRSQYLVLQQRLFEVRDGIVSLMGEYRAEWRRRFGSDSFRR